MRTSPWDRDSATSLDDPDTEILAEKALARSFSTAKMRPMPLRVIKMHGIGNDYIYVDGFETRLDDPAGLARRISDRHFGVGGDGLVLIQPPREPANDGRMVMYNADGSRAQMCGNAIRCVGKFLHDRGIAPREMLRIETDAGVKTLFVERGSDGKAESLRVDMGPPRLARSELPMADGGPDDECAVNVALELDGRRVGITGVSMGNPHAVIRFDEIESLDGSPIPSFADVPLWQWGPSFENHEWFPERVNTELVVPLSRSEMDFRVWERGSGETLACGTGACAAVVAAVLNDWCDREVLVHLRGGDLRIRWDGDEKTGSVWMTGGATEVFTAELE